MRLSIRVFFYLVSFASFLCMIFIRQRDLLYIFGGVGGFLQLLLLAGNLLTKGERQEKVGNLPHLISEKNELLETQLQEDMQTLESKYKQLSSSVTILLKNIQKIFHKSADVNLFTLLHVDNVTEESTQIESVFSKTKHMSVNASKIEKEVAFIAEFASGIRENTSTAINKVQTNKKVMEKISYSNTNLKNSVSTFVQSSQKIEKYLAQISQIASKTRTLSFNAAIQATKAGNHGAGFKILAAEIRGLAENTFKYAKEINELLTFIKESSGKVEADMQENYQHIQSGIGFFEETHNYMEDLNQNMLSIDSKIQEINESLTSTTQELQHVFSSIENLQQKSLDTKEKTEILQQVSQSLSALGEESANAALHIPQVTPVYQLAEEMGGLRRDLETKIEYLLEEKILSEKDLFQPQFTPISKVDPNRYTCKYQEAFQKYLKSILIHYRELYQENGKIQVNNIIINDLNGYSSIAYPYDKPLTGNPEVDRLQNLEQILFPKELVERHNNLVNERNVYISAYPLKTFKATISDLTFPLFLKGKRWGTLRVGFVPQEKN